LPFNAFQSIHDVAVAVVIVDDVAVFPMLLLLKVGQLLSKIASSEFKAR